MRYYSDVQYFTPNVNFVFLIAGKSLYIKRLYGKLKGLTKKPTMMKCIPLIEPNVDENVILRSLLDTPKGKELTMFHFDVTSSVIMNESEVSLA